MAIKDPKSIKSPSSIISLNIPKSNIEVKQLNKTLDSDCLIFLGVWIIDGKDVFYNQFSTVTFLCPMRFERYPLDEHICKFRVGSTNMDINFMRFGETVATFDENNKNTILDYAVNVMKLDEDDRIILYQGQNYSVTG